MHLYMTTRGTKACVDAVIQDLQAQYFKYFKDKTGKDIYVQLGVRPIQLWEVVFPKQHLNEVVKMISPEYTGIPNGQGYVKYLYSLMRKGMGIKKMPKLDLSKTPTRIISPDARRVVGVDFIGVKEDNTWADYTPPNIGFAGEEQL